MILMTRYGFVEFEKEESVTRAIKEMNGKNIWGDGKITVETAFIKSSKAIDEGIKKDKEREGFKREEEFKSKMKNVRCYRCD